MLRAILLSITVLIVGFSAPAEARHYRHHQAVRVSGYDPGCNIFMPCEGVPKYTFGEYTKPHATRAQHVSRAVRYERVARVAPSFTSAQRTVAVNVSSSRPSDCYGIPWCGCWLKHHFGLENSHLNLNMAREWARVGSPASAHSGAVVVWSHHVGVLRSDPDARGYAVVLSGNSGRGGVTEVPRYVGNAIAFRNI